MIKRLFIHIIIAVFGVFLAIHFITEVEYSGPIETIFLSGAILGFANCFIKPVLKLISLPLRIITLGIFTLIINIFLVWVVIDILSPIEIKGLMPLIYTTFIIWILTIISSFFLKTE